MARYIKVMLTEKQANTAFLLLDNIGDCADPPICNEAKAIARKLDDALNSRPEKGRKKA